MLIVLSITYTRKNFYFRVLYIGIINICAASIASAQYNYLLKHISEFNNLIIYTVHDIFYTLLISIWVLFIIYVYALSVGVKNRERIKKFIIFLCMVLASYVVMELLSDITRFGFYIEDNIPYEHYLLNPFMLYYVVLGGSCMVYFVKNRRLFAKKIYISILFLFVYCLSIMIGQGTTHSTTFNTITFFIPIITIFYLLHSNGYDSETGALGPDVFFDYLTDKIRKKESFSIITLNLMESNIDANEEVKLSDLLSRVCRYCDFEYERASLFQKNKYLINVVSKSVDTSKILKNTEDLKNYIKTNFAEYNLKVKYSILKYDEKLGITDTKMLIDLNKYIVSKTQTNTIYECTQEDVAEFKKQYYIREQLTDIALKNDINDPRVVVYAQPIINSASKYRNAEILMRLELPELGLVYPNDFIPLAEKYKLIHQLSLIILNKSCLEIKKLLAEGYDIDRFSVNFSASELNQASFYEEVISVIDNVGIPYDKLAFEITETTFNNIDNLSKIMSQLNELGVVFYLDDFGTGYSNMDRIIELPFTTIKFDRALVLYSAQKENSRFIVNNLCNVFNQLKFNVLFEGIENKQDEEMCLQMGASYLQGYKYSKPIPVGNIREFLGRAE